MNEQVLLDIRGAIATLTLNRPQAMNSLGLEMGQAFLARVEELQKAEGVKVVVVTGAGDHFMAGGDIKEVHSMVKALPEARERAFGKLIGELINPAVEILRALPQPVVGKIRGDVRQIGWPQAELTTWSPSLDLTVLASPTGATVHGRIGPQPQVWTTFMFFHMLLAMCGIGGLMWGIAQSLAGGSAWPLWIAVAALFLHAFVAGAAFIGQGLGADQTHRLRSFIDDVLGP